MKHTLILGASDNPTRYSFVAAHKLKAKGHSIVLLGRRKGLAAGQEIHIQPLAWDNIETVTLYINPGIQTAYYDYIVSLKPKRVIFNPGTENREFEKILIAKNIVPVEACTLVMLATGQY
jgi:predicted CoA-binding protein